MSLRTPGPKTGCADPTGAPQSDGCSLVTASGAPPSTAYAGSVAIRQSSVSNSLAAKCEPIGSSAWLLIPSAVRDRLDRAPRSTQLPGRDALRRRRERTSSTTKNSVSAIAGNRSPWSRPTSQRPSPTAVTEPRTRTVSQRYRSNEGQPRRWNGAPPHTGHRSSLMPTRRAIR
jgi:hypothetical protein